MFIIIKSGAIATHAKNHRSYPGALSDNRRPEKQAKNIFAVLPRNISNIVLEKEARKKEHDAKGKS